MIQQILQLLIVTVLIFVLIYGIGFILNMLLKTTWFPIYVYVLVLLPLIVYLQWDAGVGLWGNIAGYAVVDYITAVSGLAGAYLSGVTLRTLREKGYQMF